MTALNTYTTGTVAITGGGTSVVGTTTIWSGVNVKPGDDIVIGTNPPVRVIDVVDVTHLTILPWPFSTVSGASYAILQTSTQRVAGAQAMQDVSSLVAFLNEGNSIIYPVMGSAPDPSLGEDGQYALKTNAGAWQLWLRTGGVWVLQAVPVGTTYKGVWSDATAYASNDVVSRNGSGYVSKTNNTNHAPESNPTDWDLIASKGDTGATGPVPIISGTSTTSLTVGLGTQTLTTQSGIAFTVGERLLITSTDLTKVMSGLVSSYSGTTLAVLVDDISGTGAAASWNIAIVGQKGLTGQQGPVGNTGAIGPPPNLGGTSTSSITAGTGSKSLTTQGARGFVSGMRIAVTNASQSITLLAHVTSYDTNTGTMTFLVDQAIGSGTDTSWTVTTTGERGQPGIQGDIGVGLTPNDSGTFAQRAAHDNEAQGYMFLETDVSPFLLWIKASVASGDWAGPTIIGGTLPIGDMGHATDTIVQSFDYGHAV